MTGTTTRARAPGAVLVIGAGTMGAGMALAFARSGSIVSLTARHEATLDRARLRLQDSLDLLTVHGVVAAERREEILERISTTTAFDDLDFDVDLIIETIVEDLDEKKVVLRRAEQRARLTSILVTNTSSLPLAPLSAALDRPQNFAAYHWFNPPELVELVEVVHAPDTDPRIAEQLVSWSVAIGKQPVRVNRDVEGFIANRLQYALVREAYALVEAGVCSFEDVDQAMTRGLGPRWAAVGPFASMDLAGLDLHLAVAERLFPSLSNQSEPPKMLRALVEGGALGAKTKKGLYGDYDEETIRRLAERRIAVLLAVVGARGADVPAGREEQERRGP